MILTHELVDGIHLKGGTILGTSRGPADKKRAVDNLIRRGINVLFTIGGDGTQRGAREFFLEVPTSWLRTFSCRSPKND